MYLTREEEAMCNGEYGETIRKSMDLLVALGDIYGASELVKITSAQVSGVSYKTIGEAGLEYLEDLAKGDIGDANTISTLNPPGTDLDNWKKFGFPEDFSIKQNRIVDAYAKLGVSKTCTCTPYLVGNVPRFGDHIAWAESSAVAYVNSVIGARTNREGGPGALAASIVGKTPMYGFHFEENRKANLVVNVECELSGADFGALGYIIGQKVGGGIPYFILQNTPDNNDLKTLGLTNIVVNDNSIVTALLPKNNDNIYSIGFVAHLDTVDIGLTGDVHAQILKFEGNDLCLNKEKNIMFKVSDHPEIKNYMNNEIIFSDGTSVLGADNKAAISTVMSALKYIADNNVEHGDIYIAFVPDEEIGLLGSKALDLNVFKPDFAYTIDSCEIGEVVYETFNAGSASIDIEGVTAHPMSAKGVLVNPILIAIDMANEFDRKQTPECTEKKEGYIWVQGISGNQRNASLKLNIRDHNKKLYEEKKAKIKEVVEKYQKLQPRAKIELTMEDVYGNIADSIKEDKFPIDVIYEAMKNLNIEPKTLSMRGGTDGSALSVKGLLTPNYFTGAHNFHSIYEFLPIPSFHKSLETTLEIIRIISSKAK